MKWIEESSRCQYAGITEILSLRLHFGYRVGSSWAETILSFQPGYIPSRSD